MIHRWFDQNLKDSGNGVLSRAGLPQSSTSAAASSSSPAAAPARNSSFLSPTRSLSRVADGAAVRVPHFDDLPIDSLEHLFPLFPLFPVSCHFADSITGPAALYALSAHFSQRIPGAWRSVKKFRFTDSSGDITACISRDFHSFNWCFHKPC